MSSTAAPAVCKVLASGYVGQGPKVEEFECELQRAMQTGLRPLTTSTCTHALDLCWHLLDVGPGTEVLATPVTCTATVSQLATRRARIVWCDVDPLTGLISVDDVARKLNKRTRCVVAVNWGGRLCDYSALRDACRAVPVVQDAAHSFLAEPLDRRGDFVCYSFQAIKHLTTCDGGALVVPAHLYSQAKLLRWYGLDREVGESFRCVQTIQNVGYKYHMNDLCATIGLANLELAQQNLKRHRANALWYDRTIEDNERIRKPPYDPGSSWWLYTLLVDDQERFIRHMSARSIAASPVHARCDKHPDLKFWSGELPGVDEFTSHEVCIPVGWWLEDTDKDRIVQAVRDYVKA